MTRHRRINKREHRLHQILKHKLKCSIIITWGCIFLTSIVHVKADDSQEEHIISMESLYRKTVHNWMSIRSWDPWIEYSDDLLNKFYAIADNSKRRLEIIGGFEEGILAIEKATVARGEGENIPRDQTLSELYCAYGRTLLELNDVECHQLALDPHTLLIGAETVTPGSEPSDFLCKENAENALRNSATLDATNEDATTLMEKITGETSVHERKPKEFVAELFDSFADTFDEKLVHGLGYTVPQLVGEAASEVRSKYGSVLDAGCGTGLAGRYLKPLVDDVMIGVDASKNMLDIAAKCTNSKGCGFKQSLDTTENNNESLYSNLYAMDLEEMTIDNTLNRDNALKKKDKRNLGFDLIVAADVLVYFGSLSNILDIFSKISTNNAVLIFSCELATSELAPLGWRLLSSGRFSHTKSHAVDAASEVGYELISYKEIVPRMEKGEEVKGHLFTFVLNKDVKVHNDL